MMEITGSIRGAVYINGVLAGETEGTLFAAAPRGKIYLGFFPLESAEDGEYVPFVRRIENDRVFSDDGKVRVCFLRDRARILLCPEKIPSAAVLPCVISSLAFTAEGRQYTAVVYFDRAYAFAVEDSFHKVIFAQTLRSDCKSAHLFSRTINGTTVILADILEDRRRLIAAAVNGGEVYLGAYCAMNEFSTSQTALTVLADFGDPLGRKKKTVYTVSEKKLVLSSREITEPSAPTCPEDSAMSFLLAAADGRIDDSLFLLTPSLRAVGAEDIAAFLGSGFLIKKHPPNYTLLYRKGSFVFDAREFHFDFDGNLIDNVTEL